MDSATSTVTGDRLVTTLIMAVLFHGIVVLGVSFSGPDEPPSSGNPSLEVVLLADPSLLEAEPEHADYLSQANQSGSGNTDEKVRPGAGAMAPLESEGDPDSLDTETSRPGSTREQQVLTTRDTTELLTPDPDEYSEQASRESRQRMQLEQSDVMSITEIQHTDQPRITGEQSRELYVAANTRQSDVAEYLDSWRRRIERIGTLNFPASLNRHEMTGNPTLEVAVLADGTLKEVIVRRSSGHRGLDRAAQDILRLAAPFDPFPDRFKANYDILRFAYEWQFKGGQLVRSSVRISQNPGDG